MGRFEDLTGQKFGRLTVAEYKGSDNGHGAVWECDCSCGAAKIVRARHLKSGAVQSCGCLNKEKTSERASTHGMTNTRLYHIWKQMRHRCYKPYASNYARYGGRGITVCEEWKNDFQAFYDWSMANGYSDDLSIDRIDANGNYEPSNCRWIGLDLQANNKRNNHYLTYKGRTQTVAEWSKEVGIKYATLWQRISDGWSVEEALTSNKTR